VSAFWCTWRASCQSSFQIVNAFETGEIKYGDFRVLGEESREGVHEHGGTCCACRNRMGFRAGLAGI
jgi:hypothetical protein